MNADDTVLIADALGKLQQAVVEWQIDQIREDIQARGIAWKIIMNKECWEDRDVWRNMKNGNIL